MDRRAGRRPRQGREGGGERHRGKAAFGLVAAGSRHCAGGAGRAQVARVGAQRAHKGEGGERVAHARGRRGLVLPEGGGGARRPLSHGRPGRVEPHHGEARPTSADVKVKIKEALQRGAEFDADHITVEIEGNKGILRGTVRAYAEMRDAERAARNAPGITEVDNRLTVDPYAYAAV